MKNFLLSFFAFFISLNLYAQFDSINTIVRSDDNIYLYRKDFKNENDFDGSSLFNQFIIFNKINRSIRFIGFPLEVYVNKQIRYVSMEQLNLTPRELKIINSWKSEDYEKRMREAIFLDSLFYINLEIKKQLQKRNDSLEVEFNKKQITQEEIDDSIRIKKEYDRIKAFGIGIYFDWNEELLLTTKAQSFHFKIYNYFKKDIKYVYITLGAYNRVDDLIGKKQVEVVGPIRSFTMGDAYFENVFLSNVFQYAELHEVKIQFFDGTFKIFNKLTANNIRMSLELQSHLYDKYEN